MAFNSRQFSKKLREGRTRARIRTQHVSRIPARPPLPLPPMRCANRAAVNSLSAATSRSRNQSFREVNFVNRTSRSSLRSIILCLCLYDTPEQRWAIQINICDRRHEGKFFLFYTLYFKNGTQWLVTAFLCYPIIIIMCIIIVEGS